MRKIKNTGIVKINDGGKATTKGPSKIDQAAKLISAASDAVGTGTTAFSTISDHMAKKNQQFITENRSLIPEKRAQILASAVAKGTLSLDNAEQRLAVIEQDEITDRIRLMKAQEESRKARAQNVRNWGIGIGCGTAGAGILAGVLYWIFGRKAA